MYLQLFFLIKLETITFCTIMHFSGPAMFGEPSRQNTEYPSSRSLNAQAVIGRKEYDNHTCPILRSLPCVDELVRIVRPHPEPASTWPKLDSGGQLLAFQLLNTCTLATERRFSTREWSSDSTPNYRGVEVNFNDSANDVYGSRAQGNKNNIRPWGYSTSLHGSCTKLSGRKREWRGLSATKCCGSESRNNV